MDPKSKNKAIAEARSFVGCKWRHRGRSRFGIDCIGLIVKAMAAGGLVMRDRIDYGRDPFEDGLERELIEHFGSPVDEMQPGDVVLMKWDPEKEPTHVGLIADSANGLTLIHSFSRTRVIEHSIDAVWRRRIVKVFRP